MTKSYTPAERSQNGARIVLTCVFLLGLFAVLGLSGVWQVGRVVIAACFALFMAAWCWWVFASSGARPYRGRGEMNYWKWMLELFAGTTKAGRSSKKRD